MNARFNVCSASALRKWNTTLNDSFNKEKIVNIVKSLPLWGENDYVMIGHDRASKLYGDIIRKRTLATKEDWVELLARLMATEENRRELWRCMPMYFKRLATYLYRNIFITAQEFDREFAAHSQECKCWLVNLNTWAPTSYYFIPASVLTSFPDLIPRPASDFLTAILPPEWDYKTANFEGEMTRVLSVLQNMYDTGTLERGKAKVTAAQLNKVKRLLVMGEFYPGATYKDAGSWRTQLLVSAYVSMRNSMPAGTVFSSLEALQNMYRLLVSSPSSVYEFLLKLIFKGLTPKVVWGMCYHEMVRLLQRLLVTFAAGDQWLLMEGFENEFLRDPEGRRNLLFFRSDPLLSNQLRNLWSDVYVTPSTQVKEGGIPIVETLLSLFCSLGLLELAYKSDVPVNGSSPMANILALRLTPLGRYIMGVDPTYKLQKDDKTVYFEADPDHLVLRSLVDPNPYEPLIKDFARPIGSKRYVVDNASFLSGCSCFSDVKRRVDIFQQVMEGVKLPPNWKLFLHRMLTSDQGIDRVNGLVAFQLDPKCDDLIDALVTDSELRRIVVRAEGYRILVESKNLPELHRLLARYGYLVPI